jgi:peptide-methionine (R)-S-oxide reductase
MMPHMNNKTSYSAEELKQRLSEMEYVVTQEQATEPPFTGAFLHNKEQGTYTCIVCGTPLFSSDTKFDSGSGWPSFWDVIEKGNVELRDDFSHGMNRVEAVCGTCGAHLGHVFNDGPAEKSGKRYCINSAALEFKKKE